MLGRAWCELLSESDTVFDAESIDRFDLAHPETLDIIASGKWELVINCAGYTDVDGAEDEESIATAVNGTGTGELAVRCAAGGALLVHYSTDYVFRGQSGTPYTVDAPTDPLSAYGRSKLIGETLLSESGCEYLLVRTSWLYAPWGKNFILTMCQLLSDRAEVRVVDDQRGRPTSALHLARRSRDLLRAEARGIWHVADGGECSWYELAVEIANYVEGSGSVVPCTSEEFARPAPRPAYSVLDISATEALLGSMPNWRINVQEVLGRLKQNPVGG